MTQKKQDAAKKNSLPEKLIGITYEAMDERTKKVARHITERKHISKNPSKPWMIQLRLRNARLML